MITEPIPTGRCQRRIGQRHADKKENVLVIRYNLWLDPENTTQHRAVEADLERYFFDRFADYPHIRLFGADPYDYDAPFNRLYEALIVRADDYCQRQWCYVPTPVQLNKAFFRAVGRSNKFLRDA